MKTTRFLPVLALTLFAAPAMAADEVAMPESPDYGLSGYGEIFWGYGWGSDNDPEEWNSTPYGGAFAVNYWLTPTWTLQLDVWLNHFHALDYDYDYNSSGVALHLGKRTPEYSIGGFASYGSNGDAGADGYTLGVEAQRYFEDVTLYIQGGYSSDYGSSFVDAWYGHAVVRYFHDPNLMFEANAGYATADFSNGGTATLDQYRWGAKIEWKPKPDIPVSLYAAYQGHHDSWDFGYELTNHGVYVGLRVLFGQDTLKDMDRNGASLADFNPAYGRYEAWDSY